METPIFVAIAIVVTIVQKKLEKAKEQRELPPSHRRSRNSGSEGESAGDGQQEAAPRSLQDLIRQFENAQREAEQGNIEPPTPPVEEERRNPSEPLTLRDIAEAVIEVDVVDLEFLMDTFDVDENTAAEMLMDLQAHRIVGRDMGEGECDVLVHDLDELDNLLNRASTPAPESEKSGTEEQALRDREKEEARHQELERQRELNELEARAKVARENAAAIADISVTDDETPVRRHAALVSTKNIADVRRGFIWAKVLDEPRFKRRWSTEYR